MCFRLFQRAIWWLPVFYSQLALSCWQATADTLSATHDGQPNGQSWRKKPLTPLRCLHNEMLPLTPRPSGYVPPRKQWLRSV